MILINSRRAGTGNVAKIMTKNVERIEIIRGLASVQYGSAAVGEVENFDFSGTATKGSIDDYTTGSGVQYGNDKDTWVDPIGSNPDGWDDGIPSEQETDNQGAQAQLTAIFGNTQITGGIDWVDYEVDATWSPQKTSYENLAGFLLAKGKMMEDRLVLSGGLRHDSYEVKAIIPAGNTADDNNVTPNVGISYLLTDYLKLRAGYSQAFL